MPAQKLTAKTIANAKPPKSGRLEIWDSIIGGDPSLPGSFCLRVTTNGVKSWCVMYRLDGKQRRMTIGTFPAYELAAARELARDTLKKVGRGIDPAEERKAARVAPAPTATETVEMAVHEFIEKHAKRNTRSWAETQGVFRRHVLPAWGDRPLASITRRDANDLVDDILEQGKPYAANNTLRHVRKFFNWCVQKLKLEASPVAGVQLPAKEQSRDRILSDDEVCTIWKACDGMGWPFGPAFLLMLITGQRRTEVARMRWSDIDIDSGNWTLPREATKSDRLHEVPLSALAMEILASVPKTGEYVFSTTGRTPISGYSRAKKRCDALSDATDWRLHDLRRTAASGMARLGVGPHVVEKVLNHSNGQISGVAAIYNRYGYDNEKRAALDAWARHLEALISGKTDNVVHLQQS